MEKTLTNEEKKQLTRERQKAVRDAWKNERELVKQGKGTRNWSKEEREELLSTGKVSGYEGHHMKSVSLYPEHAGNSKNIQFLNEEEHLNGAHQGNYHNLTNGYYDPETGKMNEFKKDELREVPVKNLENSRVQEKSDGENQSRGLLARYSERQEKDSQNEKTKENAKETSKRNEMGQI